MFKHTFSALSLIALMSGHALATDWTIDAGDGSHIDNPGCTGSCAAAREEGRRPTPGAPQRIDGEKPQAGRGAAAARAVERPDSVPEYAFCCRIADRLVIGVKRGRNTDIAVQQCRREPMPAACSPRQRPKAGG